MRVGSRYGDFSRVLLHEEAGIDRVLAQQGRVQLDADWNAQADLIAHRLEVEATDVIGRAAAPMDDAGFEIVPMIGLRFDGRRDLCDVPGAGKAFAFSGEQPFTLEAWVCLQHDPRGGVVLSHLGESADGSRFGYRLAVDDEGHACFGRWQTETAPPDEAECSERAEPPPHTSTWRELVATRRIARGRLSHVAAVFDGWESRLYVDGDVVARDFETAPGAPGSATLLFGAAPPLFGDAGRVRAHYHGLLTGVRVWRRALSGDEIRATIAADERATAVPDDDLVADWPLDEGKGDVAHDTNGRYPVVLGASVRADRPRWVLWNLAIGPGRYYVEGAQVQLREGVRFTGQRAYPCAALPPPGQTGDYLLYLDVWERSLSSVQDPSIREVALGGADTTTRSQLVPSVRWLRLLEGEPRPDDDADFAAWERTARAAGSARMRARRCPSRTLGNYLYRVEIHDPGVAESDDEVAFTDLVEVVEVRAELQELILAGDGGRFSLGDVVVITVPRREAGAGAGVELEVSAEVIAWDAERRALVVDLDLTLIVDIESLHVGRRKHPPTFKWSRLNGSVELPIAPIEPGARTVRLLSGGLPEVRLKAGDWVEVVDDWYTLQGKARHLVQVESIDSDKGVVELRHAPPLGVGARASLHPFLRLWDQQAGASTPLHHGAVIARGDAWIPLEDGVEVSFPAGAELKTGDFWWIPARAALEGIEWPRDKDGPKALPPVGIQHRRCPLALLEIRRHSVEVTDLRRVFPSLRTLLLTASSPGAASATAEPLVSAAIDATPKTAEAATGPSSIAQARAGAANVAPSSLVDPAVYASGLPATSSARVTAPAPTDGSYVLDVPVVAAPPVAAAESAVVDPAIVVPAPPELDPRSLRPEPPRDVEPASPGLPLGVCVLTTNETPPDGFAFTGFHAVAKGPKPRWSSNKLLLRDTAWVGSAEIDGSVFLFTETNVWERVSGGEPLLRATLSSQRRGFGLGVLRSKAYLVGGVDANGEIVGDTWIFDPKTNRVTVATPMSTPRTGAAIAVLHDKLYAIGGVDKQFIFFRQAAGVCECYDPAQDSWTTVAKVPTARTGAGAAAFEGRVHVLGGSTAANEVVPTDSHVEYDPKTDTWCPAPPLPVARMAPGTAVVDGRLHVIGGYTSGQWIARADVYGEIPGSWTGEPRLEVAAARPSVHSVEGAPSVLGLNHGGAFYWEQTLSKEPVWFIHKSVRQGAGSSSLPR